MKPTMPNIKTSLPANTDKNRPISALNKLSKVKKNLPNINRNDKSLSPTHQNRIKSAYNMDKEKLYEDNIALKYELNKIKKDLNSTKKENLNLEMQLSKKDKILEGMAYDTQNNVLNQIENINDLYAQNKVLNRAAETHLVINLKKGFKDLKKDFNKKKEECEELKKNMKITKINELTKENNVLMDEISKLKSLYEMSQNQIAMIEKNVKEHNVIKENLTKKDYVINSLQENIKTIGEELTTRNSEAIKLTKIVEDKKTQILKLKKDLRFQYQINERLINTTNNLKISESEEYLKLKNDLEKKLGETKRDLKIYKELADSRERKVKDLENMIKNSNGNHFYMANNTNKNNIEENPEEKTNNTVLLLKSKLQEVIKERDDFKKYNELLNTKLLKYETGMNPDNLTQSNLNIKQNYNYNPLSISEDVKETPAEKKPFEYLSDFNLNELIYILIKNLEANKFDVHIIEERILKDEESQSLFEILKGGKDKVFAEKLTNNILNLLKIKKEKDKKSIYSIVKTFTHNNFTAEESKNIDEFSGKFLSLFQSIIFYSGEQKQTLNKSLTRKLLSYKSQLKKAISFYDENNTGFITFATLRTILEQLGIKITHKVIEYLIYVMKSFNDDDKSIHDLKYENAFKIINEYENNCDDDDDEEEENEENEDEENLLKSEESAIEITTEEYLKRVESIVCKISKFLIQNNKILKEYFIDHVAKLPSYGDTNAIELVKLIQVLNDEFSISLDSIDIYCLYTKLKFISDNDDQEEGADITEEIVNFDKLTIEVNNFLEKENAKFNNSPKVNYEIDEDLIIPGEDFIQMIKTYLNNKNVNFKQFIEEIKNKIKPSAEVDGVTNRYLDLGSFENFLVLKEIIVIIIDPVNSDKIIINKNSHNISIDSFILYNNKKINLDYLKFIIEGKYSESTKKFVVFDSNSPSSKKNQTKEKENDYDDDDENYGEFKLNEDTQKNNESFVQLKMDLLNDDAKYPENNEQFMDDLINN